MDNTLKARVFRLMSAPLRSITSSRKTSPQDDTIMSAPLLSRSAFLASIDSNLIPPTHKSSLANPNCCICLTPFSSVPSPRRQRIGLSCLERKPSPSRPLSLSSSSTRSTRSGSQTSTRRASISSSRSTIHRAPLDNRPIRLPRCGHIFGKSCVEEWLRSSNRCPLCRQEVCEGFASDLNDSALEPESEAEQGLQNAGHFGGGGLLELVEYGGIETVHGRAGRMDMSELCNFLWLRMV